jgi:hypothetical protein
MREGFISLFFTGESGITLPGVKTGGGAKPSYLETLSAFLVRYFVYNLPLNIKFFDRLEVSR